MERRLIAILAADVVGYSHLMSIDERGTFAKLKKCERDIIEPTVKRHNGQIFKRMGDGYLVEFSSVVDCVECALAWQNLAKNMDQSLKFRIGVNLGDVLSDSGDIYGDGVNIAARLESIAKPGGISISGSAYDQVKRKLPYNFLFTGEQKVKNIPDPVRVYQVELDQQLSPGISIPSIKKGKTRISLVSLLLVVAGIVLAFGYYYLNSDRSDNALVRPTAKSDRGTMSESRGASIVVLPFENFSNEQTQEYFVDGITNDIITDLSRFRELFVIASDTAFFYKGKSLKTADISEQLKVRYILQGSVQRMEDKIRINAQLVDTMTGTHIWAERFERELKDLFTVQDEIVQSIVTKLAVKIHKEERERAKSKSTSNLDAYDYLLRGQELFSERTRSANNQARQMFEKAIEMDSNFASAYVGLGATHLALTAYGWTEFSGQALDQAHTFANKALNLDEENSSAHALLGAVYRFQMKYDQAIKEYERAIELNPNDADSHAGLGAIMNFMGQTGKAIQALETAYHFNPHMRSNSYMQLGIAYYLQEQYNDSIGILEQGLIWYPDDVFIHIPLAAAYAMAGRDQDIERTVTTIKRLNPFFEIANYGLAFSVPSDREKITDGLRKAGL